MKLRVFFLAFISLCLADQAPFATKRKSFTIDLIHRDSTYLSQQNDSINSPELLRKAVLRSLAQANHFNSSVIFDTKSIESQMIVNLADYLMRFYLHDVNNAKYEVLSLASTGSEFFWINCNPCDSSYKQTISPFKPNDLTYEELLDTNDLCIALRAGEASTKGAPCIYKYSYQKIGFTSGILSAGNFYFTSTDDDFTRVVFGCSHETKIKFDKIVQGIVGLGRGKLSLIRQLVSRKIINPVFSYCLVPNSADTNSRITLGEGEIINSDEKVTTSFSYKHSLSFYFLTLEGFTVEGTDHTILSQKDREVIIDSGTAMTLLRTDLYNKLEILIKNKIGIKPKEDGFKTFKLCFNRRDLTRKSLPLITFNFAGGKLRLKNENMFVEWYSLKCLAIYPYDGISIIGNVAQIDFLVEYDLKNRKVSFTPTDCTKLA